MNISTLFVNLLPLCALVGLGWIAGARLKVEPQSLASLAIFILAPLVNFGAVARLDLNPVWLLLPVIMFGISTLITLSSYVLARRVFSGDLPNFIGMASSSGNTGYFGLPIVTALLGPDAAGVYLLMNLAFVFMECTLGYYIGARGQYDVRESVRKLLRLPTLYAVAVALVWNVLGLPFPETASLWWQKAAGAWSIVGMMLVGVVLAQAGQARPRPLVTLWLGGVRFIVWPVLTYCFVMLDRFWLSWYEADVHIMILIMGLVPLAGNLSAFATQLGLRAGEAAWLTLVSTLFAAVYIPGVVWLLNLGGLG